MDRDRIIVIGGGPAGLMAAGQAAAAGVDTLLLEKGKRAGRKLRITGKGRCNITNTAEIDEFLARFGNTGDFLRHTFSQFFNTDLMAFLQQRGLNLDTERGGRVFPASGKAEGVVAALVEWTANCGAHLKYSTAVDKLLVSNGRVSGVVCRGRKYPCKAAILATGGASYPATGSTGDGYRLAASVGHNLVPIRPALVPLTIASDSASLLDGVQLRNTNVRLLIDDAIRREAFGEVAFTRGGIGGPVVLTVSGQAVDAIDAKQKVALSLDLKPALSAKQLDGRIDRDLAKRSNDLVRSFLRGLLPRQLVSLCLIHTGISGKRPAKTLTATERQRLICWLKGFRLPVTGYRPLGEAIITAGGIATEQVDPQTLGSRLVSGLFMAGEVLDIDADTGGYNLQAAFSTGWLAGRSAAAAIVKA